MNTDLLRQLERHQALFCRHPSSLDDPARVAMWVELGTLYTAENSREASACWGRALWELPDLSRDHVEIARQWFEREHERCPDASPLATLASIAARADDEVDSQAIRVAAACVIHLDAESRARTDIQAPQLPSSTTERLHQLFRTRRMLLDIRTLWLAKTALARLVGFDQLRLFEARDLVMDALGTGARITRSIPMFIRRYGDDEGLARRQQELARIRDEYLATKRQMSTIERSAVEGTTIERCDPATDAYVRLIFAWGFARLNLLTDATAEHEAALERLEPLAHDPVHACATATFVQRIAQAQAGLPMDEPLTALKPLKGIQVFKFDRLCQVTRILSPYDQIDAFKNWSEKDWGPSGNPKSRNAAGALADLLSVRHHDGASRDLHRHLLIADRYECEELIGEFLSLDYRSHLERSIGVAVEYANFISRAAPIILQRGFGQQLTHHLIEANTTIGRISYEMVRDNMPASSRSNEVFIVMKILARVHIAVAHATLGDLDEVDSTFDEARQWLGSMQSMSFLGAMLRGISTAFGRSSTAHAISWARIMMERLSQTTDSMSTTSHYCLAVIQLMDSVVTLLASEELLSTWAERWIAEDERLLLRRIQSELASYP